MVHRRNTGRREGEKGGAAKGGGSRLQLDGRRNADLALVSRDSRKSVPLAERRAGLAVDRRSSSRWAASTRRVQVVPATRSRRRMPAHRVGHGSTRPGAVAVMGLIMMMVLVNATVVRSVAELLVGEKQRASWWWWLFLVVMEGCGVGCSLQVHM
ncbi:proline-rich receptor-like protein kinase PERK9 [Iris pallida]|uniref:Proline-rich receptor-like protein kinase PERK9 n=1 Tax=Iris pallida TaxID=29817 RepID=A0AAX6DTI8_IRIPA|nr:proline-rich receptor-like protein kinase PERK9 [Iris pallida]